MAVGITILGSTGSIGVNTLDVIARQPGRFDVYALTAHRNVNLLFEQCRTWMPKIAVMTDEGSAKLLRARCRESRLGVEVLGGAGALADVAAASEVDYVMAGIVGSAGLLPNLAAARAGKRVMLANKESLVMSGQLFMDAIRQSSAVLLPIDSEHNAIFQSLPANFSGGLVAAGVEKILLTASGGPFREFALTQLEEVTPEQACAHPNWVMGKKISVDSATMMNKGLEVIEACWLFNARLQDVEVLIHPQSVIHSMVRYVDGSVLAQLGNPDMRTPIAYSLAWPDRCRSGVDPLDLTLVGRLDFERPDEERFPCLRLAREAMAAGGTAPAILNAANEVAVDAFLSRQARFLDIPRLVADSLESIQSEKADTLESILAADEAARQFVSSRVSQLN